MQSIILDHCWLCPAKTGLHEHHVVPRAYGGVDGPTVTVCGGCHTTVHTAALKPPSKWNDFLPERNRDRYIELVEIIYRARVATKREQNKPLQIQHTFTPERSRKIRELKTLLSVSSINSVIDRCVDLVYEQQTPLKKRDNKPC